MIHRVYRGVMFRIGYLIGVAICEPQLRWGRITHDGRCDDCDAKIKEYAAEHLDFPNDGREPEALETVEMIRRMAAGSYRGLCFECYFAETGESA